MISNKIIWDKKNYETSTYRNIDIGIERKKCFKVKNITLNEDIISNNCIKPYICIHTYKHTYICIYRYIFLDFNLL